MESKARIGAGGFACTGGSVESKGEPRHPASLPDPLPEMDKDAALDALMQALRAQPALQRFDTDLIARNLLGCVQPPLLDFQDGGVPLKLLQAMPGDTWTTLDAYARGLNGKGTGLTGVRLARGTDIAEMVPYLNWLPQLSSLAISLDQTLLPRALGFTLVNLSRLKTQARTIVIKAHILSPSTRFMLAVPQGIPVHGSSDSTVAQKSLVQYVGQDYRPVGKPVTLEGVRHHHTEHTEKGKAEIQKFIETGDLPPHRKLNGAARFSGTDFLTGEKILCRHLGMLWALERIKHLAAKAQGTASKFRFDAFETRWAIREKVTPEVVGAFVKLKGNGPVTVFDPDRFEELLALQLERMTLGDSAHCHVSMQCRGGPHICTIELRVAADEGGGPRCKIMFMDPKHPVTDQRMWLHSPRAAAKLAVDDWLKVNGHATVPGSFAMLFPIDGNKLGPDEFDKFLSDHHKSKGLYLFGVVARGDAGRVAVWVDRAVGAVAESPQGLYKVGGVIAEVLGYALLRGRVDGLKALVRSAMDCNAVTLKDRCLRSGRGSPTMTGPSAALANGQVEALGAFMDVLEEAWRTRRISSDVVAAAMLPKWQRFMVTPYEADDIARSLGPDKLRRRREESMHAHCRRLMRSPALNDNTKLGIFDIVGVKFDNALLDLQASGLPGMAAAGLCGVLESGASEDLLCKLIAHAVKPSVPEWIAQAKCSPGGGEPWVSRIQDRMAKLAPLPPTIDLPGMISVSWGQRRTPADCARAFRKALDDKRDIAIYYAGDRKSFAKPMKARPLFIAGDTAVFVIPAEAATEVSQLVSKLNAKVAPMETGEIRCLVNLKDGRFDFD